MAFAEDLSVFLDAAEGFAVVVTLAGSPAEVIFDAPGVEALGGDVLTTEPSVLVQAAERPAPDDVLVASSGTLPAQLQHLAGTYVVRNTLPEPPDGVFVRCFLAKTA